MDFSVSIADGDLKNVLSIPQFLEIVGTLNKIDDKTNYFVSGRIVRLKKLSKLLIFYDVFHAESGASSAEKKNMQVAKICFHRKISQAHHEKKVYDGGTFLIFKTSSKAWG